MNAQPMAGKTVLVTGASTGIGKVAAREIAALGATVTLVCQHRQRGEAALAAVGGGGGNDRVDLLLADFGSLDAVRGLASTLLGRLGSLDVLVNNAGVFMARPGTSADGFEATIAINHLAPFLLTNLLRPLLEAAPSGRVVNVASAAHHDGAIDLGSFRGGGPYDAWRAYSQSKLANVLFTYELAERLAGTGITANCLHPGFIPNTNLVRGNVLIGALLKLIGHLPPFKTAERGARTIVYLASAGAVEGVTGRYFVDEAERRSSRLSLDPELRRRLWVASAERCGIAARAT